MIRQGIDFEESIKLSNIKITFGIYGRDGALKTAFFVDNCHYCPLHGKPTALERLHRYEENSKLVSSGIIVIRAWQCLVEGSPNKIADRLKFSVNRLRNLKAYCSILRLEA